MIRSCVLVAVALAGCGVTLNDGERAFGDGRYADAKADFAQLEGASRGWSDARRAEYALYRGLTLNALGDHVPASKWLTEAKAIDEAHPGALKEEERTRLKLGLDALAATPATAAP